VISKRVMITRKLDTLYNKIAMLRKRKVIPKKDHYNQYQELDMKLNVFKHMRKQL